ncbi:c-type cytochrome [Thermoflexus sp.]|uniref:c-type cytochrome n=1 Tax=Thermoflexus sp. TaxID=1969742 RepID=UPI0035E45ED9
MASPAPSTPGQARPAAPRFSATPTASAPIRSSPTPSSGAAPGPFATLCETCHPQGGTAPGTGPSLRGVARRHSPGFIRAQILNGRGDMPGFRDRLKGEELERLLAYLQTLEGEPPFNRSPPPVDPEAATRGQELFRQRCESCHLEGGRWPGSGLGFEPPAPVLIDELRRHTPAFIARQIREGGGQMPAVGADLTDAQVADLIAYLSALALEDQGD